MTNPKASAGRRIMVFVQPGVEVVLVPSPLIGDTDGFTKDIRPLGKIIMNAKHSLWFENTSGNRVHLAKAPNGKPKPKVIL